MVDPKALGAYRQRLADIDADRDEVSRTRTVGTDDTISWVVKDTR